MCGIAGKVVMGGQVGLINRRLAIQDLTLAGHQPMNRGKTWVTFNGEIYNFREIRETLRGLRYRFRSGSDTEVILAGYDAWGIKVLDRLRGQFGLAIYDDKRRRLFLARDRFGEKPLKYTWDGTTFVFASELKAILTQAEVKREVNWQGVYQYLTYGYIPAPQTSFAKIYKLEPAHYLVLDLVGRTLTKKRYWDLDFSSKWSLSVGEWRERLLAAFFEATKLQMMADVPVVAFLSGGVDSSALVAMMARCTNKKVKTFSIGFAERSHDETGYAQKIADMFGTDHQVIRVNPWDMNTLYELVDHFEELLANSSLLVSYAVAKQARRKVTVALSGDGGDENFTGYLKHEKLARDLWFENYKTAAKLFSKPSKWTMENFKSGPAYKWAKYLLASQTPWAQRYITYNCYLTRADKDCLYTKEFSQRAGSWPDYEVYTQYADGLKNFSPADRMLYADLFNYLPEDLLTKTDLASMAVSLENRSPYLDHKFVELTAKIPFDLKVRGGEAKYIWKRALRDVVPAENIYRKKMGFGIPLDKWFNGKLGDLAQEKLLSRDFLLKEVFDQRELARYLKERGQANVYELKLWAILYLQLWMEKLFRN